MKKLINFKASFILLLITVQIFVVFFLGVKIYEKKKNVLGAISINPIRKEDITTNNKSKLKYFKEPISKKNIKEKPINWIFKDIIYTHNSDGLNERFDYSIEKSRDAYRIVTLGDSFTYGLYVDTEDNWTEKLEDMLNERIKCDNYNKFEVINLGVPGYDIQYSVERYRLRGQKYNPELVLWLVQDNDFDEIDELMYEKEVYYKKEILSNSEFKKIAKNKPYIEAKLLKDYMNSIIKKEGEEKILSLVKVNLTEINKYLNKKLLFTTFVFTKKEYKQVIKDFIQIRGDSYFFDLITDINEIKGGTYKPYDYHPAQKGHEIIAQDIFNYLTKNNIIPCD